MFKQGDACSALHFYRVVLILKKGAKFRLKCIFPRVGNFIGGWPGPHFGVLFLFGLASAWGCSSIVFLDWSVR